MIVTETFCYSVPANLNLLFVNINNNDLTKVKSFNVNAVLSRLKILC